MKQLTFNVDTVLPALLQVSSVVSAKNSMPILSDIIIKSFTDNSDGKTAVMFSASDNEKWLSVRSEIIEGLSGVEIAVNASDFVGVLKNLTGRTVALSLDEKKTTLKGVYENGEFSLPLDNPKEFPHTPIDKENRTEKIIDSGILLNAIAYTEFAAVNDVVRPIMGGVHFDFFQDKMVSVALNSSFFSKYTDETVTCDIEGMGSVTIPNGTTRVMSKLLAKTDGDVKLSFNDKDVMLSCKGFRLISRLLEGKYPPYDQLLRSPTTISATASRDDIIAALKRVMPLGSSTSESCVFVFTDGNLKVFAEDINFSKSASENIKCDYKGDEFKIVLKGSSVTNILSNITDDNVEMRFTGETKAAWFLPERQEDTTVYVGLVMPMLL